MQMDINQALRQFEATEANLEKLERLWDKMAGQLPRGGIIAYDQTAEAEYERRRLSFQRLLAAMPAIDGHTLSDCTIAYRDLSVWRMDAYELDEPSVIVE